MISELEVRDRIVEKARELFFQFGFSRVTMEEIASALGISKKTLYKHFSSKYDVMKEVMQRRHCEIEDAVSHILDNETMEFADKIREMMATVARIGSQVNKTFLLDIQRSCPELCQNFEKNRRETLASHVEKMLEQGIQAGFFRSDIDRGLVVLIYMTLINNIMSPETLSNAPFTIAQAYNAISQVVYEGIFTNSAREKYTSIFLQKEAMIQ